MVNRGSSIRRAISLSILNQGLSSAANFIFGLYLVRTLVPVEFGIYGIGFAISLFVAGIGNSIFLTQMVVNYGDRIVNERREYLCRMFAGLLTACVLVSLVTCLTLIVAVNLFEFNESNITLCLGTLIASVGFLLKDFFVRQAYTEQNEGNALLVNIAVAFSILVLCFWQHLTSPAVNAAYALSIYGISNLIGSILGLARARFKTASLVFSKIKADVNEAWFGGGGWYLLVTIANAIQTQAHTIVGAVLLGPLGVATMNAARLLLTPPLVLLPALNQVFLPRMVERKKLEGDNISTTGLQITFLLVGLTLLYIAILFPMMDWLFEFVIKSDYKDLNISTYGWFVAVLFIAVRSGFALENHAKKEFKKFFYATLVAGFASVVASWIFIFYLGAVGGPLGLALGEFVLVFIIIKYKT